MTREMYARRGWGAWAAGGAGAARRGAVTPSIAQPTRVLEAARLPHRDEIIVGQFVLERDVVALVKPVDPARHQLRRPPAWCVAQAHLARLAALARQHRKGAKVRLLGPRGERWEASLVDFEQHGFDVLRDEDRQRGLPLGRWRQRAEGAVQLSFDALPAAGGGAGGAA